MESQGIFNGTFSIIEKVLDLRSTKHKLTISNIANADTPNYKAFDLIIEEEMKKEMGASRHLELAKTDSRHFPAKENALDNINLIPEKYEFTGRKPRKGDVINSAIDFLYAILYGIITKAIVINGLDPFYGFIHTLKSGRLSLTYDLSEMFKPIIIHSIIQASRKANLKTFRNSRLLKPKTIETLTKYLYYRFSKESEKIYKRK